MSKCVWLLISICDQLSVIKILVADFAVDTYQRPNIDFQRPKFWSPITLFVVVTLSNHICKTQGPVFSSMLMAKTITAPASILKMLEFCLREYVFVILSFFINKISTHFYLFVLNFILHKFSLNIQNVL